MTSPAFVTGQEAGLDTQQYVQRLRDLLGDIPRPADEQIASLGNTTRYNWTTVPINDDDTAQIYVGGVLQTIIQSGTPSGSQVLVNFTTGRTQFGTPPASNVSIVFYKNTVRWRDSTILEALTDGARNMWPKLGRIATDDSLTFSVNQWQYDLPPIFNDPNVRLLRVSVRDVPASTNRFLEISSWNQIGINQIMLPTSQAYTPGANIMLEFEAPYSSLSQVEAKAQSLPLWYAAGMLLGFKETQRTQDSSLTVQSNESAQPAGYKQNTGSWYMKQFYMALNAMPRVRRAPTMRYTWEV